MSYLSTTATFKQMKSYITILILLCGISALSKELDTIYYSSGATTGLYDEISNAEFLINLPRKGFLLEAWKLHEQKKESFKNEGFNRVVYKDGKPIEINGYYIRGWEISSNYIGLFSYLDGNGVSSLRLTYKRDGCVLYAINEGKRDVLKMNVFLYAFSLKVNQPNKIMPVYEKLAVGEFLNEYYRYHAYSKARAGTIELYDSNKKKRATIALIYENDSQSVKYFDKHNNPTTNQFGAHSNVRKRVVTDTAETGECLSELIYTYSYGINKDAKPISQRVKRNYLDKTGKVIRKENLDSSLNFKCHKYSHSVEYVYDGELLIKELKYSCMSNSNGSGFKIEKEFDYIFDSSGVYIRTDVYDHFLGNNGVKGNEEEYKEITYIADNGRIDSTCYINSNGEFCVVKGYYSESMGENYFYNEKNQLIEKQYLGAGLVPTKKNNWEPHAIEKYKYDEFDRLISTSYYDSNGKPTIYKSYSIEYNTNDQQYFEKRFFYNAKKRTYEEACFGLKGERVICNTKTGAYSYHINSYDKRGNIIETARFDTNGNALEMYGEVYLPPHVSVTSIGPLGLVLYSYADGGGYLLCHKTNFSYNEYKQIMTFSFRDHNNNPIPFSFRKCKNVAVVEIIRDRFGAAVGYKCYDAKGLFIGEGTD